MLIQAEDVVDVRCHTERCVAHCLPTEDDVSRPRSFSVVQLEAVVRT
jgi:hypothetical protein